MARMNNRLTAISRRLARNKSRIKALYEQRIIINRDDEKLLETPRVCVVDDEVSKDLRLLCDDQARSVLLSVCDALRIDPSVDLLLDGDPEATDAIVRAALAWLESIGVNIEGDLR